MTTRFELFTIRELIRLYRDSSQRITANRRARLLASSIGWTLVLTAFLLAWFKTIDSGYCVVIAAVGGFVEGWSFLYLLNAETIPIFVRFTTLKEDEVQKALEESKNG